MAFGGAQTRFCGANIHLLRCKNKLFQTFCVQKAIGKCCIQVLNGAKPVKSSQFLHIGFCTWMVQKAMKFSQFWHLASAKFKGEGERLRTKKGNN